MRFHRTLAALAVLSTVTASAQQGVPAANIDTSLNACTDFDAYANGAWRKANPMPAIQTGWALRTVAQDFTRGRLRTIAEEDAAKSSSLKTGSPAQLTGDFYAGCMDEKAIDARRLAPLEPWQKKIAAVHDDKTLSAAMIAMESVGMSAPVAFGSEAYMHDPTHVIAEVGVRGLGLPDRDYYVRDEPRYKNARDKYVLHVQKMLMLAGEKEADAKSAADAVMKIETALAQSMMTRVERRDPHNEDHITTFAALQAMAPHYDWESSFDALGLSKQAAFNVGQPKVVAELNTLMGTASMTEWQDYLTWHLLHAQAARLPAAFGDESFAFYGTVMTGAKERRPRWQRCVAATDGQ